MYHLFKAELKQVSFDITISIPHQHYVNNRPPSTSSATKNTLKACNIPVKATDK
ncbi:unnamed protein product [Fusarium graminearum]|uniref:Chromosome 4, complete genome n=1 Tax=Gibberella zeae (strain ATCC MYA-4620 / CBS 123657 / FGSC 9075 / NRRL 31084 / PH-1) TaxID=229533 RepID=A0A098DS20_GIBZE|nr:unnamed protein product [Fusarium graminearum]CZS74641.1 unnamed protein product [Fusarium graminearum]